jgi:nucleotide-binding universal stress UspA family protein
MFETLLVAVDGSDCARRAAAYGFGMADRYEARVDVLHVLRGRSHSRDDGATDAVDERGREILRDVVALAADYDVDFDTHLVEGPPHEAIVDRAATTGADLVAMGRHGRTGLGERLLGTVTDRVLRRTDRPVLTVPEGPIADDTGTDYRDVLVTTDGSENAARAAPFGADVARRFEATLHVLHAVDVQDAAGLFNAGGVSREFVERLEARGREATDRLAREFEDDVAVRSAVERGVPHRVIGEYAADNDVDLIAVASEGESNLAGQYLGSVTGRVLRTVDVPTLVVVG